MSAVDRGDTVIHQNGSTRVKRSKSSPKITFDEFCNRASMHGIPDWHQAKGIRAKSFWTMALMLCLSVSVFGMYSCMWEFYVNPIVTSIAVIPVTSQKLPVVVVCPSNFINRSRYYGAGDSEVQFLIDYFKAASNISEGIVASKKTVIESIAEVIHSEPDSLFIGGEEDDVIKDLAYYQEKLFEVAYQIDEFVRECYVNSLQINCSEITGHIMDKDYGVCFAIRPTGHQVVAGLGLTLLLDLNTEQYPDYQTSDGAVIKIDRDINPLSYEATLASPGTHAKMMLSYSETRLISVSSFSRTPQICVNNRPQLVLNVSYSRESCQFDCFQSLVRNSCDCFLAMDARFIQERHHQSDFCSGDQYKECVQEIASNQSLISLHRECSLECDRACYGWHFAPSLSFEKLPSVSLLSYYSDMKKRIKARSGKARTAPGHKSNDKEDTTEKVGEIPRGARIDRWTNNIIMLDVAYSWNTHGSSRVQR